MTLKIYQMMGYDSPYAQEEEDSDIEMSEDEIDLKQAMMTNEELEKTI